MRRRRVLDDRRSADTSTGPPGPGDEPPATPRPGLAWNVPHRRKEVFVGREHLLEQLESYLQERSTVALVGLGGMGKTALVVEYAYRHGADYDVVWWVRADTPVTLGADHARLAPALGLSKHTAQDQARQGHMARRWLEGHDRWLLVLDDARDFDSWRPVLPNAAKGHVLVTTQAPVQQSGARTVAVRELSREDAVAFLLLRTGEDDVASARHIADALGGVPLALEQAAGFVQTQGTLADYVARLRRDAKKRSSVGHRADYPYAVATTWRVSSDAIRRSSRSAIDLLRLCAHLGPDDIPYGALMAHNDSLPSVVRPTMASDQFDQLVAILRRFSLVEHLPDALSIHRLVQAFVRENLSSRDQRLWAGAAVSLMASTFPAAGDDPRNWPACERLLPHALIAVEHAYPLNTELRRTSHLLYGIAVYLRARGQFEASRAASDRALAIDEAAYGPDHPAVGADLNNLGLVLRDLGDLTEAKESLERALAIAEAAHGPDDPTVATRLNNLGLVLRDLGDLTGAKEHFLRAVAIDQAAYGPDHQTVGADLNNLGLVLRDLGDPAGANERFLHALAIAEAAEEPDHRALAIRINNLALVLQDLGDLAGAKKHLERALAIDEAADGPAHPKISTDLNNVGLGLQDLGDLAGARECFERALAIDEDAYGAGHPEVGTDLNNLGLVLQDLGDFTGAKECLQRALLIDEAAYGPDHPEVGTDLNNLGLVLQDLGDFTGAKDRLERAMVITEAAYGPNHPKVARVLNNLAAVLRDLHGDDESPADAEDDGGGKAQPGRPVP